MNPSFEKCQTVDLKFNTANIEHGILILILYHHLFENNTFKQRNIDTSNADSGFVCMRQLHHYPLSYKCLNFWRPEGQVCRAVQG